LTFFQIFIPSRTSDTFADARLTPACAVWLSDLHYFVRRSDCWEFVCFTVYCRCVIFLFKLLMFFSKFNKSKKLVRALFNISGT